MISWQQDRWEGSSQTGVKCSEEFRMGSRLSKATGRSDASTFGGCFLGLFWLSFSNLLNSWGPYKDPKVSEEYCFQPLLWHDLEYALPFAQDSMLRLLSLIRFHLKEIL